jgi:hypothetical protein
MRRVAEEPSVTPLRVYSATTIGARAGDRPPASATATSPQAVWCSTADGLTTWAESGGVEARSDCHAWNSQPIIELFRTVLGVDSAAPGLRRVPIRPHPGALTQVTGAIPHQRGEVRVSLQRAGDRLEAAVDLPPGTHRRMERWALAAGANRLGS